nr:zinc knuckle CX2CX4HX4C [Tanacetum cinerariifolium]
MTDHESQFGSVDKQTKDTLQLLAAEAAFTTLCEGNKIAKEIFNTGENGNELTFSTQTNEPARIAQGNDIEMDSLSGTLPAMLDHYELFCDTNLILPPLPFSFAATFANILCRQPLPSPLSLPCAKLIIMALEEYEYQSRKEIRVSKKWRSSYSGDVIFFKKGDEGKPLALPYGRTLRLDSDVRVKKYVVRMAGVGTLVGHGSAVIVTADANFLPRMSADPCKITYYGNGNGWDTFGWLWVNLEWKGTIAGVDINTLTMEQYLALSQGNQAPGMVKPKIGGNVNFEIKRAAKRWVDKLTLGAVNTWDLLKKAFIQSSSNSDGLAVIVSKLENLECDMKKLKETVHAIQVRCQICEGPYLDKDCPLNKEVKKVEKVNYGEFGRPAPFNESNGAKFCTSHPRYFTQTDNRLPYGERRPILKELMSKHQEEAIRRSTKIETTNWEIKVVTTDHEKPSRPISSRQLNNLHGVSFISDSEEEKTPEVLQVLSLEQTKTNQAAEIKKLKKRVKKLEGKKKKRTYGLKRLYKHTAFVLTLHQD